MKPRTLQIHLQKELSRLYDAHEAAAIATRYVTDRVSDSPLRNYCSTMMCCFLRQKRNKRSAMWNSSWRKCRCNKLWGLNGFVVIVFG